MKQRHNYLPTNTMQRATPFARAKAMFAAIAAASAIAHVFEREKALQAIGPYVSRGKGKGRHQASSHTTAQSKRAAIKARNVKLNRAAHRG